MTEITLLFLFIKNFVVSEIEAMHFLEKQIENMHAQSIERSGFSSMESINSW